MFGIGLPEMILILALALIVVGPDKLPELARSIAKGVMELKKTAEGLKESFSEEGNPFDEIKPELEDTAKSLQDNLLESTTYSWKDGIPPKPQDNQPNAQKEPSGNEESITSSPPQDSQPPLTDQEYIRTSEDNPEILTDVSDSPKTHNTVRDDLAAGPKA